MEKHEVSAPKKTERGRGAIRAAAVLLVVLQLVFGSQLSIYGAVPDFMLVLTAALAFAYGSRTGCIAGFCCGLLFDLLASGPVGPSSLLGCVAGFVLGGRERNVLADGWRPAWTLFLAASLVYNALHFALLFLLGAGVDLGLAVLGRVVASTAFDGVLAAAVFMALARACSVPTSSGGIRLS